MISASINVNFRMAGLHLSETEQRYFSDLYLCCGKDNSGNVTFSSALDLFQSGDIPSDALQRINELVFNDIPNANDTITRKEFYSVIKLIAAYKTNIPLSSDILTQWIDTPLPRFTWLNKKRSSIKMLNKPETTYNDSINHETHTSSDPGQTDSDAESGSNDPRILDNDRPSSQGASSTASESPTPTNSVQQERNTRKNSWSCEEQRQLLATEEESSDGEVSNEVWCINSEQRDYYIEQFNTLQPVDGIIPGPIARPFFEKSRLNVNELRKIWQLSDITRDGALNLQEFSIAMHLVVLRRNNIPLPDVLPDSLWMSSKLIDVRPLSPPLILANYDAMTSSQTSTATITPPVPIIVGSEEPPNNKIHAAKEWTKFVESPTTSDPAEVVQSPGPVNFDFYKASVETDPKILHPVPLRVTPNSDEEVVKNDSEIRAIQRPQVAKKIPSSNIPGALPPPPVPVPSVDYNGTGPMSLPLPGSDEPSQVSNYQPAFSVLTRKDVPPPPPPPRPVLKAHVRSSSLDLNRYGAMNVTNRTLPPNCAAPVIPPRTSPCANVDSKVDGENFASFEPFNLESYDDIIESCDQIEVERQKLQALNTSLSKRLLDYNFNDRSAVDMPRKHGAFEVYRKPLNAQTSCNTNGTETVAGPCVPSAVPCSNLTASSGSGVSNVRANKKEMLRRVQEQNVTLLRICQELSQELADIKEERIKLTYKLHEARM